MDDGEIFYFADEGYVGELRTPCRLQIKKQVLSDAATITVDVQEQLEPRVNLC